MPTPPSKRDIKNRLYEQVARVGKVMAHPKRLELIEILSQGEKQVAQLAADADISIKLVSAHLKELRLARLVITRREGKCMMYRLADEAVATLWVHLRLLAEQQLPDLQSEIRGLPGHPDDCMDGDATRLWQQARRGDVVLLDVRPAAEFAAAHLPYARSIPVSELSARLDELPSDRPIVAYCRGPFCLMAQEGVELLQQAGRTCHRLELGVAEWRAQGLPLA